MSPRLLFRALFRRSQAEEDLDRELQYHTERLIEEGVANGLTPDEARFAALRTL
jgi:hypothetical protein